MSDALTVARVSRQFDHLCFSFGLKKKE